MLPSGRANHPLTCPEKPFSETRMECLCINQYEKLGMYMKDVSSTSHHVIVLLVRISDNLLPSKTEIKDEGMPVSTESANGRIDYSVRKQSKTAGSSRWRLYDFKSSCREPSARSEIHHT